MIQAVAKDQGVSTSEFIRSAALARAAFLLAGKQPDPAVVAHAAEQAVQLLLGHLDGNH